MRIYWEDAPSWAGCVIRTRQEDDGRLWWAEPWGTLDGKRQEMGSSRRYPDDIADTSKPNSWVLVATRPDDYGLPAIGANVHVHDPEGLLMYGAGESGEVIAHVENTAVIRMSYGLGCFTAKHLKTKEQFDKESRSAAIMAILDDLNLAADNLYIAERVYDRGYRKEED